MKRTFTYLAGMIVALGILTSCGSNKTIDAKSTNSDSLSYALGVHIAKDISKFKSQKFNLGDLEKGIKEGIRQNDSTINEYNLGFGIGAWMKREGLDNLSIELIKQGMKEALSNDTTKHAKISGDEASHLIEGYFTKKQEAEMKKYQEEMERMQQEQAKDYEYNKEKGEKFLAENKTKQGVVELPSGLQYKLLKEGNGPKPTANDIVRVFYRGTTIDGVEFDSNMGKEPVTFMASQVIPGWTEGLQLFNAGSRFMLYIPYNLAYGTSKQGSVIEPYMTLIFEIDLLEVNPKKN